jgi:PTH1 family peptidyl-tRNA hydrolase
MKASYLIAGLGNPGSAFRHNRHNVGFMAADAMAAEWGWRFSKVRMRSLLTSGRLEGRKVFLAKPQTYVNLSGRAVASLVRYYRIPLPQLLVIEDDLDLPLGTLRIRPSGGSGGHKGLRSIAEELGTQEFPRLRIGVGRPPGSMDPADFVLQDFSVEERESLPAILARCVECAQSFLINGIEAAMERYNGLIE